MLTTPSRRQTLATLRVATMLLVMAGLATPALAVSPRNPYRSFNLSGINYGSMRWEQQHRTSQPNPSRRSKTRRSRASRPTRTIPSSQVIEGEAAGSATSGDQRASSHSG